MTQDKAPEWARKMAEALPIHGDGFPDDGDMQTIALALSQAYERGQVDMRERAADEAERSIVDQTRFPAIAAQIRAAIRSLPIDSAGKDEK